MGYIEDRIAAGAAAAETEPETEQVVQTEPVDEVQTEVTTETVEETTETQIEFDDEQLNTFFDTTGKTKDDIKNVFTLGTKYSELEKEQGEAKRELESLRLSNAELKKGLDPLAHFSSESAYVAEQLRKKYPDMDAVAIQQAVTKDLSLVSDLDVLALQDVIKHPGVSGGETMSKRILAGKYGIDLSEPIAEWDEVAKAQIERDAFDARREINSFKKEVEIPVVKSEEDIRAARANKAADLQKKWDPVMTQLTKLDKITIPREEEGQVFEFEVPQSFRDELPEYFKTMIISGELEPGEETVKLLIEQRNKEFVYKNLDKIMGSFEADLLSSVQEQTDKELGNTAPANTQTKPPAGEPESGTEAFLGKQLGRNRRT